MSYKFRRPKIGVYLQPKVGIPVKGTPPRKRK